MGMSTLTTWTKLCHPLFVHEQPDLTLIHCFFPLVATAYNMMNIISPLHWLEDGNNFGGNASWLGNFEEKAEVKQLDCFVSI